MKKKQTKKKKQKQRVIVFDNAIFKKTINKKLINSKSIKERLMNYKFWEIENNKYEQQKWAQIFTNMIQTSIIGFLIQNNQSPNMPKQISNVWYTNLTSLYLKSNQIKNIEALTFINYQNLLNLGISCNNISSIKCFNKLSMPLLKYFEIFGNPIYEFCLLNRTKTNPQILETFVLQYDEKEDKVYCQDLGIILKLNCKKLRDLLLKVTTLRIKQLKIQKMLVARFGWILTLSALDRSINNLF